MDHTLAGHILPSEPMPKSLELLQAALDGADTHAGRCWAVLLHGVNFFFLRVLLKPTYWVSPCPMGPSGRELAEYFPCTTG